jgi:hypothetical protein
MTNQVPNLSLDRFAELSAEIADPFAERSVLLRRAGLDEESWSRIIDSWMTAFTAPDGEHQAARFGEVFARTKRRLAAGPAPAAAENLVEHGPQFLSPEAQPWRGETAGVGDTRTSTPPPLATASAPQPLRAEPPPPEPAPVATPLSTGAAHPLAGTTDVDPRALGAVALPFASPATEDLKGTLPAGTRADEIWPFPNRDPGASR